MLWNVSEQFKFGHSTCIKHNNYSERNHEYGRFSSLKFSRVYLNGEIPGSCKVYMLQLTDCSMKLFEYIDDCIELINSEGDFCIVGWYKRGQITDKSMITAVALNTSSNPSYNNNPETVHVAIENC